MLLAETSRSKNCLTDQKPAPRFFCETHTFAHLETLPQVTETHQQTATYVYNFVPGCTVAPVSADRDPNLGKAGGRVTGKALPSVTDALPSDGIWFFEMGINGTPEKMALAKVQLIALYQSDTEMANRMRAIEASGNKVTIYVSGPLRPGWAGYCKPGTSPAIYPGPSMVTYEPMAGVGFWKNGNYHIPDGMSVLAHEIGGHAYDIATRIGPSSGEHEATRIENEIRYMQGHSMLEKYGSTTNKIQNHDLYAKRHY